MKAGRKLLLTLGLDLVVPIALYYGLRLAGLTIYAALLIGAVALAAVMAWKFTRTRRTDGMAVYVMTMMLLGVGVALITGSPRFLLAKDGWLTGVSGLWFLASLWGRRPLAFLGARPLLEGRFVPAVASWDVLWERLPRFRRIWRVSTVIWGVFLLGDAALRVLMAYTLPVDLIPLLSGLLWGAVLLLLQVVNNIYYIRAGLYDRRSALYEPIRTSQGLTVQPHTAPPSDHGATRPARPAHY
jgi:intracellular septation protein A